MPKACVRTDLQDERGVRRSQVETSGHCPHGAHKVLATLSDRQAIELSRTPWSIRSATPEPGEHTDAVLSELGYGAADIAALHAKKVV